MYSLSKKQLAYSRHIQADILQNIAAHKRCHLAQCLNVDATTVGRWLDSSQANSRLEQFATILAICDLKVVPVHTQYYDQHKINILFQLAKDSLARFDNADAFFMTSLTVKGDHDE